MAELTEHIVKYDGGNKQINYLASGPSTGPLLIFIHGWPGIGKTWQPQLTMFASLGFRVVAPDMPGYGKSTANKKHEDYSHQNILLGLLALLADNNRDQAIWIGHDWGSGVVSSLVAVYPEVCKAMIWLAIPYKTVELGLEELVKYVNRDVYPVGKYPYGQWDYMAFYEESFDKATAWFDQDIPNLMKYMFGKGDPAGMGKPAFTTNVRKDGGWFGGVEKLPPATLDRTLLDEETYKELSDAMQKTGFFPGDSYYMNHKRNRAFNLENQKNGGVLDMPVLFIEAKYDHICDTVNSRLVEPMAKYCKNFSMTTVDAGHYLAYEKPSETNAAIVRWLCQEVKDWWPGYWHNGMITHKK